jgi:hypothetical protein
VDVHDQGLYGRGRTVIRQCRALPYCDFPYKRDLETENDGSPSSKPASLQFLLQASQVVASPPCRIGHFDFQVSPFPYAGVYFIRDSPYRTGRGATRLGGGGLIM